VQLSLRRAFGSGSGLCDPLAEEGRDGPVHGHAAGKRAEHAHGHGHGGHAGMPMAPNAWS
jgi:hypothetical protein